MGDHFEYIGAWPKPKVKAYRQTVQLQMSLILIYSQNDVIKYPIDYYD